MTGSVVLRGRMSLLFCGQKRSKKTLIVWVLAGEKKRPHPKLKKVFCFFFFKKEGLPYLAEQTDQRSLDTQVGITPRARRR